MFLLNTKIKTIWEKDSQGHFPESTDKMQLQENQQ